MTDVEREQRGDDRTVADDGLPTRQLIAYSGVPAGAAEITPAPRWREWMNATDGRWANRCLPLLVANQSGWTLLNQIGFTASWNGGSENTALTIEFDGGQRPRYVPVESLFGYGIVTWRPPYLFRTPPGWNLLARGPANWPKDGVCALEGVVETDWTDATFTMNWKLTRPDNAVRFEAGEPFCMIVPQRRHDLESFLPEIRDLRSERELFESNQQLARNRHDLHVRKFLGLYSKDFESARYEWERHYFKGLRGDGSVFDEHQTELRLAPFARPRPENGETTQK